MVVVSPHRTSIMVGDRNAQHLVKYQLGYFPVMSLMLADNLLVP